MAYAYLVVEEWKIEDVLLVWAAVAPLFSD
jgi:hypothetical protein